MLTPESVLSRFLSQVPDQQSAAEKKLESSLETARNTWFTSRLSSLAAEVTNMMNSVTVWMVRMGSVMGQDLSNLQLSTLGDITIIILQGVELATSSRNLLNQCISFYTKLTHPLTKSAIMNLAELMTAVKQIQVNFIIFYNDFTSFSLLVDFQEVSSQSC